MTEKRKNQSEEWTYFNLLFIYFITGYFINIGSAYQLSGT